MPPVLPCAPPGHSSLMAEPYLSCWECLCSISLPSLCCPAFIQWAPPHMPGTCPRIHTKEQVEKERLGDPAVEAVSLQKGRARDEKPLLPTWMSASAVPALVPSLLVRVGLPPPCPSPCCPLASALGMQTHFIFNLNKIKGIHFWLLKKPCTIQKLTIKITTALRRPLPDLPNPTCPVAP